jgi:hypothetical protein
MAKQLDQLRMVVVAFNVDDTETVEWLTDALAVTRTCK